MTQEIIERSTVKEHGTGGQWDLDKCDSQCLRSGFAGYRLVEVYNGSYSYETETERWPVYQGSVRVRLYILWRVFRPATSGCHAQAVRSAAQEFRRVSAQACHGCP